MKQRLRILTPALTIAALLVLSTASAQDPGMPQSLTMEQAVGIALERNLTITLAQSQVRTSTARVTGAFGTFLPQISIESGYSKLLTSDDITVINGIPFGGSPSYSTSTSASAQLVVFDGFSRTSTYDAAQSSYSASLETLARTKQDITFQTRASYLNALRAEQIIDVRQSDLEVLQDKLVRSRQRVEAGVAQIGIVYSEEAEVANAELSLEQARTDAVVARNNLALLLNYDPTTELQLSTEGIASSIDTATIAQNRRDLGSKETMLQRQALQRRDIQALRLRLDASESSVGAARSGYWPRISTSLTWQWSQAGSQEWNDDARFGIGLSYTPFDGFQTNERVELAEAERQSVEIELRRLEIQARSDLQSAVARLDGAERQLRAADKAVSAARQNRFAADERYRLGAGVYSDYILASAQYLSAQINQVNAVFNYRLALYEIRYLLGE